MPFRLAVLFLCLLLCLVAWPGGPALAAEALKPAQKDIYTKAFAAAQADRWTEARTIAARVTARDKDALLDKALHWMDLTRADTDATFAEITAFLRANPTWPHRNTLRLRGEQKMPETLPATAVSQWFAEFPPLTQDGRLRQLAALKASGHTEKLTGLARTVWQRSVLSKSAETDFLRNYGPLLRAQDHASRLDWLLWEGHLSSAERMLPLVPADLFRELEWLLEDLQLTDTVFRSDHASNYLVLKGILGADKPGLLRRVREAIEDPRNAPLRQEWQRGL